MFKVALKMGLLFFIYALFCLLHAYYIIVACNMHIHCIAVAGWFDVIYVAIALCIQNAIFSLALPKLFFKNNGDEYQDI